MLTLLLIAPGRLSGWIPHYHIYRQKDSRKDGAGATLSRANYYAVPSHPFLQRIKPVRTVPPA